MKDISKCANITCPLKDSCLRYVMPEGKYQSYAEFEPKKIMGIVVCDHQIEIDNATPTI